MCLLYYENKKFTLSELLGLQLSTASIDICTFENIIKCNYFMYDRLHIEGG